MKRLLQHSMAGILFLLASIAQANPVFQPTVSLLPQQNSVVQGTALTVDLLISGISEFILGGFDIDLAYDTSVLNLTGIHFGTALGDETLGESLTYTSVSSPGNVNLTQLSLLESHAADCQFCLVPYLEELQGSSFILVSLNFDTIGTGDAGFGLSVNLLSDGYGEGMDANQLVNPAQITSVPLPAAIWLFASMLPLFGWKRTISC